MKTQLEMALEERAAWDGCTDRQNYSQGLCEYAEKHLGAVRAQARIRNTLLLGMPSTTALWEAVESGMPLGTASRLYQDAKRRDLSVQDVLDAYNAAGYLARGKDGKTHRRVIGRARAASVAAGAAPVATTKARHPMQTIREAVAAWIAHQLDGMTGQQIIDDTLNEIEAAMATAQNRIRQRKNFSARMAGVPRQTVINACNMLGIRFPKPGQPVDVEAARKAKRNMLRATHPDVVGNNSKRDAFQAINDAYTLLVEYNDGLTLTLEAQNGSNAGKDDPNA